MIPPKLASIAELMTPCGPATDILLTKIQFCLLDLFQPSSLAPLNEVHVAQAMLESFEPGAVPRGNLGYDEPDSRVEGRLCSWLGACWLTRASEDTEAMARELGRVWTGRMERDPVGGV